MRTSRSLGPMPGTALLLLPSLLLAVAAWRDGLAHDAKTPRTFYGAEVAVGDGIGRSYIRLEEGRPAELGVALSERAVDGLPAPTPGVDPAHHLVNHEYLLPLPAQAIETTPYRLVELDWNPGGHEPPGIDDPPHFDFHFHTITEAERPRDLHRPMITRGFLMSRPDFSVDMGAPEKYEVAGKMPTSYRVYWDEASSEYRIALTRFTR